MYNIIFTIPYDSVGSCLGSFIGRTLYHLVQDLDQNSGHDDGKIYYTVSEKDGILTETTCRLTDICSYQSDLIS